MNILLLMPLIASFFVTFFIIPRWIKRALKFGFTGRDMNKYSKEKIAEGGGLAVVAGFILAILAFISIKVFFLHDESNLVEIFSIITSFLMLAMIGITDGSLGWKVGLRRRERIIFCFFAAVPLMVINAGYHTISLPFFGNITLGLIYPLILIPLGIIGTSTTFNFLAGFNGLEAGQGILIISALSLTAYFTGQSWLALTGLCLILSLLAFWIFNKHPARVFPGDALTYPVGGMIAIMAILGNFERIAVFFFIPYIIEVGLKARGKLLKQSFGKPNKDNSLEMPYEKIYGLEHLAILILKKIKGKAYEKDVVLLLYLLQLAVIIAGFIIFRSHIF